MNKKRIAKETLIFFGSIFLILIICGVWYLFTNKEINKNDVEVNQIGFREKLYDNLSEIKEKGDFRKIIEINDKAIFLKTVSDTSINRKLYNKAKELEEYVWNGNRYSKNDLNNKYGEKVNSAIQKFGFKKTNYLTELNYAEFNKEIQSDNISSTSTFQKHKNEINKSRDYYFDVGIISIVILIIIYPIRWIYSALKWSVKEIKTNGSNV